MSYYDFDQNREVHLNENMASTRDGFGIYLSKFQIKFLIKWNSHKNSNFHQNSNFSFKPLRSNFSRAQQIDDVTAQMQQDVNQLSTRESQDRSYQEAYRAQGDVLEFGAGS